jgi:hypothetical protein
LPPLELVPAKKVAGRIVRQDGTPLANASIHGTAGNRCYSVGLSNEHGEFQLDDVPRDLVLNTFRAFVDDRPRDVEISSNEPLLLILK